MTRTITLIDVVYRDVVTNIFTGRFKTGDQLPSLMQLCEKYEVGRNTVRSAVCRLEKDGYIKITSTKQIRVSFDIHNQDNRERYMRELSIRKDALLDVCHTTTLVLPDIIAYCIQIADAEQRTQLTTIATRTYSRNRSADKNTVETLFLFYSACMSIADNHLLSEFFGSMFQYMLILVSSIDRKNLIYRQIIQLADELLFLLLEQIRDSTTPDYREIKRQISALCEANETAVARHLSKIPVFGQQVEYLWLAQRRQDLLYSSLIDDIIQKILNGSYHPSDLLPSYSELSRRAGVSEKTSRKAVAVLNQLRIVKTINGKGTRVVSGSEIDLKWILTDPSMRESLRLSFEALHLMAVLCRPIIYATAPYVDDQCLDDLAGQCFIGDKLVLEPIIGYFYECAPSACLRMAFQQMQKAAVWCRILWQAQPDRGWAVRPASKELLQILRSHDPDQIADLFWNLYQQFFTAMKCLAAQYDLAVPLMLRE